jgi:uncharacterized protein
VFRKVLWDEAKAEKNLRKHNVSFFEAAGVLESDPLLQVQPDQEHSWSEDRFLAIGATAWERILFIAFTIRQDLAWLISAREATSAERRRYIRGDMIQDREEPLLLHNKEVRPGPRYIQRVGIDDDVAEKFVTSEAVNRALHRLIDEGRAPAPSDVEIPIPRSVLEDWEPPAEYDMSKWNPIPFPRPQLSTAEIQVSVELDILRYFPDDEAINAALRTLIAERVKTTS